MSFTTRALTKGIVALTLSIGTLGLAVAPAAQASAGHGRVTAAATKGKAKIVKAEVAAAKGRKIRRVGTAASECANTEVQPTAENLDVVAAAIVCLHNKIRVQNGLTPLTVNVKLNKAALGHSNQMVAGRYFEHVDPDGTTFVDRLMKAGYAKRTQGWTLGENLAWGTGTLASPTGLMNAWMNSPAHKANIVKKAYREIGIGITLGNPTDAAQGATVTAEFGVVTK